MIIILLALALAAYFILYIFRRRSINKLTIEYKKNNVIFETSAIGLELYNKKGILVKMNDAACKIYNVKSLKQLLDYGFSIYDNKIFSNYISKDNITPCWVFLDKYRVLQILNNFTSNAIKYTSKGKIVIGYCLEDKGIKLYVKDSGKGIPESLHNIVFDRFEKLGSFEQGTGLGLTICKAIAEAGNGKIWFESQVDVGSNFYVWLPLSD